VPDYWGLRRRKETLRPGLYPLGLVQLDAAAGSLGSSTPDSRLPLTNGTGAFPAHDALYLRRLRLGLTARLTPAERFVTLVDYGSRSGAVRLLDMYFESHSLWPGSELCVGQFKTRWGWEGLRGDAGLNTIERSDATVALYPGRDIGLNLEERSARLDWDAGFYLGYGATRAKRNRGRSFLGRLLLKPRDDLFLGFSTQLGTFRPDGLATDLPVRRYDVELRWYRRPLALEAEYLWSDGFNPTSRRNSRAAGGAAALVWEAAGNLDAVLSYDWYDPDLSRSSPLRAEPRDNARNRLVLGVNYYLDRAEYHRIMLNYEFHSQTEGPALHDDGWRMRYQYRF
jgi:hypothetical protein